MKEVEPADHEAGVLLVLGLLALAVGALVYLTDRAASHAALIPNLGSLADGRVFGSVGQWLPSFIHPFAFALFTASALPPDSRSAYGACVFWCVVNIVFEIGQHPLVSHRLAEMLQASPRLLPVARPLANYFVRGTFDVGDIVAAALGSLAVAAALRLTHRRMEARHAN